MTWFKVDDKLAASRKVLSIPRARRAAAMGLWVLAGSWCSSALTDGRVPAYMVEELAGTEEAAHDLVAAGLWETDPDGWVFHDWTQCNPSREQVENERAGARERMAKLRNRSPNVRANTDGTSELVRDPRPVPSRPSVPTEHGASEPPVSDPPRWELVALSDQLADAIVANGGKRPNTAAKSWLDPLRLMLDRDGRTVEEVGHAIRWCQADEFWRGNILSTGKLREKFDQMRLQAERKTTPKRGLDWDAQMDRARALDAQEATA